MKIPFVQQIGIGVYFAEQEVRWVELARLGAHVWTRRLEHEPIQEGNRKQALGCLVERIRPDHSVVASHLPPAQVREQMLELPGFQDEAARRAWIETQVERQLPEGTDREDFVLRVRLLGDTGENRRCLVTVARRSAVAAHVTLLRSAGLEPFYLGSLTTHVGYAYGFDPAFEAEEAAILLVEEGRLLGFYEAGRLADVRRLHSRSLPTEARVRQALEYIEVRQTENAARYVLHIAGSGAEETLRRAKMDEAAPSRLTAKASPLFPDKDRPTAADAPAAGLATVQLYAAEETGNLLPPEEAEAVRQEAEKKDALRTMLAAGSCTLLLLICAIGVRAWFQVQVEAAEAELRRSAARLARVDSAAAALQTLRIRLGTAERLTRRRTHAAALLEEIGRATPERLWLRTLTLKRGARGGARLTLSGRALSEGAPPRFMQALDRRPWFSDVRLVYVERLSDEKAEQRPRQRESSPVRFEMHLTATVSEL